MKKIAIYTFTAFIILIFFKFYTESESSRDYLSFNSSPSTVKESIVKMNMLIKKISQNNSNMTNYILLDNNNLIINNKKIGIIDSITKIDKLNQPQAKEFINLVKNLNINKIKSCYLESNSGIILYNYERNSDGSDGSSRNIYLKENDKDYSIVLTNRTILDEKDGLVLIKSVNK
jgi:hypothetical protein